MFAKGQKRTSANKLRSCPTYFSWAVLQALELADDARIKKLGHATAIFRQVDKKEPMRHHDALEFPDGRIVLLTKLSEGQEATVFQLPAQSMTAVETDAQKRIAQVG